MRPSRSSANTESTYTDVPTRLDFPTRKEKRGAVQTGGYESDSSNEGDEDPKPQASNADDEDDMFGATSTGGAGHTSGMPDLDAKDNDTRVKDSGLQLKGEAAKGGKEFLELGDIEGQEFNTMESSANAEHRRAMEQRQKVHEDEEDYVDGEEHANDDDAIVPKERKSATGMGFAMSGFNMSEEMAEGRFTADGSYEANKRDPDAVHDNWLRALSSKDIEAAKRAKERQDALYNERSKQLETGSMSRIDCLKALIEGNGGLVKEGETVQAALVRLGKVRKAEAEEEKERIKRERRQKPRAKPAKDFDAPDTPADRNPSTRESAERTETQDMDLDPLAAPKPSGPSLKGKERATEVSQTKFAIDMITTLASTLLGTHGETDIYEETHEGIIRQLIAEAEVPRGWKPNNSASSATASEQAPASVAPATNGSGRRSVVSRPLIARP